MITVSKTTMITKATTAMTTMINRRSCKSCSMAMKRDNNNHNQTFPNNELENQNTHVTCGKILGGLGGASFCWSIVKLAKKTRTLNNR